MKRLLVFVVMIAIPGCGGDSKSSPAAPSQPSTVQMAGKWGGTFESSNYAVFAITAEFTQAGTSINGTWAETGGIQAFGKITGAVDTSQFTGTITYSYPNSPTTCEASISGTAGFSAQDWRSAGLSGNCSVVPNGNPTNLRIVLQKR